MKSLSKCERMLAALGGLRPARFRALPFDCLGATAVTSTVSADLSHLNERFGQPWHHVGDRQRCAIEDQAN
jgi:hypothetical protein